MALLVAALAIALFVWHWFESRLQFAETRQELAQRLAQSDQMAKESLLIARQVQDQTRALQTQLGELDTRLAESRSQQAALESLYQELASGSDERALAEIEQNITLAAQQLQFAANVSGALQALQAAEARLAANGTALHLALRKALVNDIDRLKALPQPDLAGISARLESIVAAISSMPLAMEVRAKSAGAEPADQAAAPPQPAWQRAALDLWQEVKGLVRIERLDSQAPALLSPDQRFFLRENLKLRLLNARLAMLSRDQWIFRNELQLVADALENYFDRDNKAVKAAIEALRQLDAAEFDIELPPITESLSAIHNLRASREQKLRTAK